MPNRFVTIDLGSNSFHMLMAELNHGEIKALDSISERVMLAEGLSKTNGIAPEAMARGIASIERFAERIKQVKKSNIKIVGTNTLRAARNAGQFVAQLEAILGVKIHIISGLEEARLIYLGVSHSWSSAEQDEKLLVLDIGGGSTEIMYGKAFKLKHAESLRMGCIAFRRFFADNKITPECYNEALRAARFEISQIMENFVEVNWHQAVGSAGTFKAIETILIENRMVVEGIRKQDVLWLRDKLLNFDDMEQLNISGLKPARMPSIVPGVAICQALFEALDIKQLHIARGGLREGVLYDLIGRNSNEDIRQRSINAICKRYKASPLHARRTLSFAKELITHSNQSATFNANQALLELLHWSIETLQIGLSINHSQYQFHSAYLLKNSELKGFSIRERELLSVIVQNHRRKLNLDLLSDFSENVSNGMANGVIDFERSHLYWLVFVIRLAHLLAQTEQQSIDDAIISQLTADRLKLKINADWLKKRPAFAYALELESNYWQKAGIDMIFQ